MQTIRLGILGHGTVGRSVKAILQDKHSSMEALVHARTNQSIKLQLVGVLVREPHKHDLGDLAFTDGTKLLNENLDVVIELLGGVEPASSWILQALAQNTDVVTANKHALFHGQGSLEAAARQQGRLLVYEAAVAGAIPIMRSLRGLGIGTISRLQGIINGSTNYILTQVTRGMSIEQAIAQAQTNGYLEANATSDLEGRDAMYKLGILCYLVTGHYPKEGQIERVGIDGLTALQLVQAQANNQVYKLVATADFVAGNYSVKPVALDVSHPLAGIHGSKNGITLWHEYAGELSFQGAGAGGPETASAVIGNLLDVICDRLMRQ